MAYLAFAFAADAAQPTVAATGLAEFSATEWAVIRLARNDGMASVCEPSRIGAFARRIFGLPAANRLADPRLEALRQAAVQCRYGKPLSMRQVEVLLGHGFRFGQIAMLSNRAG